MHVTTYNIRRNQGFSLIYVIALGGITALAAMAVTESLLASGAYIARQRHLQEASTLADTALHYAVAKINRAYADNNGNISEYDTQVSMPAFLPNVTVNVQKLNPGQAGGFSVGGALADSRVLTATAKSGGITKTIKVLIGTTGAIKTVGQGLSTYAPPDTNYFSQTLQATNGITLSNTKISEPTGYGASISANGVTQINGNVELQGSINAYNPSGNALLISPDASIGGNVQYSGGLVNNTTTGDASQVPLVTDNPVTAQSNVFGDGKPANTPGVITSGGATSVQSSPIQSQTAAFQPNVTGTADPITGVISNMTISAPSTTAANPVVDLGTLNVAAGQTVTLNPGVYVVNSLAVDSGGTLAINVPSSSSQGVQIYVQGNAQTPLQITGAMVQKGSNSPNNLQVFYNGTQPITVQPTTASFGLLYAPNASITMSTNGGTFSGAIVGDTISASGSGGISFDPTAVSGTAAGGGAATPKYYSQSLVNSMTRRFSILTWYEP